MKNFIAKYYPVFINIYTVWMLYMLFFAYSRGYSIYNDVYVIRPYLFQSIENIFTAYYNSKWNIMKNITGNIVCFIPYGFLGLLYPKLKNYGWLFLTFFIGINYVEFSQYFFNRGYAELDDVILNTLGMTIGFILYKRIFKI